MWECGHDSRQDGYYCQLLSQMAMSLDKYKEQKDPTQNKSWNSFTRHPTKANTKFGDANEETSDIYSNLEAFWTT